MCVLVAAYTVFYFNDYVETPKSKYNIGWILIGLTILNIVINGAIMLYAAFQSIMDILRYICRLIKRKKP
jgi:fructose-specific phosphotransferase system IIC component